MGTPARFLIRAGNFGHGRSAFALLVARQPHNRLFSQDKLRKIEVEGGTAQTIASVPGGFSAAGTWGTGDNILFAPSNLLNLLWFPALEGNQSPLRVWRELNWATSGRNFSPMEKASCLARGSSCYWRA